jgi:peptide/nickel transport system substrate-binding protein
MYHQQRVKDFTIYRRGPSTGTRFLVFNQNPRSGPNGPYVKPHKLAWFRDRRFRRAIAHAIDRKAIAEIVFKRQAYIQDSPVSKANTRFYTGEPETYDERFEEEVLEKVGDKLKKFPVVTYAYDLDKANAYLDDMGLTERNEEGYRIDDEGRVAEFVINTYTDSPDYARIISIMKTEFKRVGVKANMVQLTFSGLVSKLMREHNWEAIIIGLTGGYGDPMNSGRNVWPSSGNLHMWNPQQKTEEHAYPWELRINEIFSQAQRTPDYAERLVLAAEFQHIVSREAPLIYTVNEAMNTAVYNRFGNFNPTVYSLIDYSMIYDRELKKKRQREK